jgi:dTDP-4-dehydrorhamnose 3,5-epimerase
MQIERTKIEGVLIVRPKFHRDDRGWFAETYTHRALAEAGFDKDFVQENHSCSFAIGTIRGLHFQRHPSGQDKLVRCIKGAALDVIVDIRENSPTFGQHVTVRIDTKECAQVLVPIGMAHGFCTLEEDTEVTYKVTSYYDKNCDGGILWNDPDLAIEWPLGENLPVLSQKDSVAPRLAAVRPIF